MNLSRIFQQPITEKNIEEKEFQKDIFGISCYHKEIMGRKKYLKRNIDISIIKLA
jgi:hypothetical protein